MTVPVHVSDRAVLRYLERAYGLDVAVLRRYLAGRAANAVRLGAVGVTVDNVKLVLRTAEGETYIVTALKPAWPARGHADIPDGD